MHLSLLTRCQPCVLTDSTAWLAPPSFECLLQARRTCMKGFFCTTTTWHLHAPAASPLLNWCRRLQHTSIYQKRTRTRLLPSLRLDTYRLLPNRYVTIPKVRSLSLLQPGTLKGVAGVDMASRARVGLICDDGHLHQQRWQQAGRRRVLQQWTSPCRGRQII